MAQASVDFIDKTAVNNGAAALAWFTKTYNGRKIGVMSPGDIGRFLSLTGNVGVEAFVSGFNGTVTVSASEMLSELGTFAWRAPTVGTAYEIVSDSASDAVAGTGALTVQVVYVRLAGTEASQTFTMTGTTAIAFTHTDVIGVQSARVMTAGSGGENAGNISIRVAGAGANHYRITASRNASRTALYTVPTGKVAIALGYWANANQTSVGLYACADFDLHNKTLVTANIPKFSTFAAMYTTAAAGSPPYMPLPTSPCFPALTQIYLTAVNGGGADAEANGMLHLLVLDAG